MHPSSMQSMADFFRRLDWESPLKILDVGSMIANRQVECYRDLISTSWEYQGLDLGSGHNVDIIAGNPFNYPIDSNAYDVVISGQCVEHVSNPFRWIVEIYRILKSGGIICVIGPSAGPIHRKPPITYDYWRIFPDGMEALLKFVGFADIEVVRSDNEPWRDCIGIARKP